MAGVNGTGVVQVNGDGMTIGAVWRVAAQDAPAALSDDTAILARIQASYDYVTAAVAANQPIYGITTLFGGMSDHRVPHEAAAALQRNLTWAHKAGAGAALPLADVRAAMLLRANALMRGVSGVRLELIQRLVRFLNAGVTPVVPEFGSIGASGDLVPLAYIAGAITGLDDAFVVDMRGERLPAPAALARLGLAPLALAPKEGLALMNGTSVMTGIAANSVHRTCTLLALGLGAHALMFQGMAASNQAFHPFIHAHKPHMGQRWVAAQMLDLVEGSRLVRNELDGRHDFRHDDLIQDRYSLRCLPQYLGPFVDGLARIGHDVTVEMNSATDNPLIDAGQQASYHCGNFLGQYIAVGMDQLRYHLGLLAKHLDVQIALLVAPEFNLGLAPSLVGNTAQPLNIGLKALQLCGNSLMPLLTFYGNSLADRFPTHAEQFNQNVNSQGFGSANLARQSVAIMQQYMAVALLFGVQAVDLRTFAVAGSYDARSTLSPRSRRLYEAVHTVVGHPPSAARPLIWDDQDQFLDEYLARIAADIAADGQTVAAVQDLLAAYAESYEL